MRYPGPEGRQGDDLAPQGTVSGSTGLTQIPAEEPSSGQEEQPQGGTARGTRVPMELGSTMVLV